MYKTLTISDNVWGNIQMDYRYAEILSSFPELKDKKQLGLTCRNPNIIGGKHSRYDHSIGTYYVANLLVKSCDKFKNYFQISTMDIEAFLLSALLHDVGHGPYSHSFEELTEISHEEETIRLVGNLEEAIDRLFQKGMCSRVIAILRNSYEIKKEGKFDENRKPDLLFVLSALLSGAIDVDRLDYLTRDLVNINGYKKDFTAIFDYMDLDLVDDLPKIVFSKECIQLIEDYFLTRYRSYDTIYYERYGLILDKNFEWFLKETYTKDELTSNLSENDIENKIKSNEYKSFKAKRCAEVLEAKQMEQVLNKQFDNETDLNVFLAKLDVIVSINSYYFGIVNKKIVIYDSQKNNVLIRVDDKVSDFTEVSNVIKDKITKKTTLIFLDLILLENFLKTIGENDKQIDITIKRITKLFNNSMHEVEKKFSIDEKGLVILENYLKQISDLKEITNNDQYYKFDKMPNDITIRERNCNTYKEFTLKLPASDSTSLTKRQEHVFDSDTTSEEFLKVAKDILTQNKYSCELPFESYIKIVTERKIFIIDNGNSVLEVALDYSKYIYNDKIVKDRMIEIELKQGNPVSIYYFVEKLNKNCSIVFEECKVSKYNRALVSLKL